MLCRVPSPFHVGVLDDLINLPQFRLSELNITPRGILKCTLGVPGGVHNVNHECKRTCSRNVDVRRSRKRYDVWSERANPGNTQLCGGDTLLLGKFCQRIHDRKVVLQVLFVTQIRDVYQSMRRRSLTSSWKRGM